MVRPNRDNTPARLIQDTQPRAVYQQNAFSDRITSLLEFIEIFEMYIDVESLFDIRTMRQFKRLRSVWMVAVRNKIHQMWLFLAWILIVTNPGQSPPPRSIAPRSDAPFLPPRSIAPPPWIKRPPVKRPPPVKRSFL